MKRKQLILAFLLSGVNAMYANTSIITKNANSLNLSDTTNIFRLGEVIVFGENNQFRSEQINHEFIKGSDMYRASEVLNWIPGLTVTDAGMKSEGGFMLRGTSSDHTPIYFDGVPMTAAYDGSVDLHRLPIGSVSKIDVSKTGSSLLLGGNTFGQSINLISQKPSTPFELHLDANSLFRSNLNIGGKWGKWYAQADFGYSYEPDFKFPGKASDYDVTAKDGTVSANPYLDGRTRLHTHSHDFSMNVKGGFVPNATDEYVMGYSMIRSSKDVPPTLGLGKQLFRRYSDWDKDEVYFHSKTKLFSSLTLKTRLYYDKFYNVFESFDDFSYTGMNNKSSFRSVYDDYTLGGHLGLDWNTHASNVLKLGINYKNDVHKSHNEGEPVAKISEGTYSFVLEDEYKFTGYLSTVASLGYFRHEGYSTEMYGKQEGIKGTNIFEMPTSDDSQMNGLVALDYHPSQNHHLRFTGSRTSRFANMRDRYSYKLGKQLPNPELGTEKSWNLDLTYEGKQGHFNWMASAYYTFINDVIQEITGVDPSDLVIFQNQNKGRADYRGFEIGAGYELSWLTANASYSYIDQENKDDKSLKFLYTPSSKFNAFVEVRPIWDLRIQGRFIAQSKSYSQTDGSGYVAGFGKLDMSIARRISQFDVKLGVLNLTDKKYEYTSGYPMRGRTWYVSASFDL